VYTEYAYCKIVETDKKLGKSEGRAGSDRVVF
jgi:hypothetical protein